MSAFGGAYPLGAGGGGECTCPGAPPPPTRLGRYLIRYFKGDVQYKWNFIRRLSFKDASQDWVRDKYPDQVHVQYCNSRGLSGGPTGHGAKFQIRYMYRYSHGAKNITSIVLADCAVTSKFSLVKTVTSLLHSVIRAGLAEGLGLDGQRQQRDAQTRHKQIKGIQTHARTHAQNITIRGTLNLRTVLFRPLWTRHLNIEE